MNNSDTVTTTGDTALDTYACSGNRHTHMFFQLERNSKVMVFESQLYFALFCLMHKHHHEFQLHGRLAESFNPMKHCLSLHCVIKGWQRNEKKGRDIFTLVFFFLDSHTTPCSFALQNTLTHIHKHKAMHSEGLEAAGCLSVLSSDISMTTNRHCVLLWGPLLGFRGLQREFGSSPFKMLQIMFTGTAFQLKQARGCELCCSAVVLWNVKGNRRFELTPSVIWCCLVVFDYCAVFSNHQQRIQPSLSPPVLSPPLSIKVSLIFYITDNWCTCCLRILISVTSLILL